MKFKNQLEKNNKKRRLSIIIIAFFSLFFLFNNFVLAEKNYYFNLYNKANNFYQEASYKKAIDSYKKILQKDIIDSAIFYNLGNAYFRLDKLGEAIYFYYKAKELSPRDPDINYNLNYVRSKTSDKIEDFTTWHEKFFYFFSFKESFYLFIIFLSLFIIINSIILFKKNDYLSSIRWLAIILSIFFITSIVYQSYFGYQFGVVNKSEVKIYSGSSRNNVVIFTLHEGTKFSILDTASDGWIKIQLDDNKKGWMRINESINDLNSKIIL